MIVISHTLGNNSVRIEYRFKRDVHIKNRLRFHSGVCLCYK